MGGMGQKVCLSVCRSVCLSVGLSVGLSVCPRSIFQTVQPIDMKLNIHIHMVSGKKPIDFGPNRINGTGVTVK